MKLIGYGDNSTMKIDLSEARVGGCGEVVWAGSAGGSKMLEPKGQPTHLKH